MFQPITLPLWIVVLILLVPGFAIVDRLIGPPVRWYFRRRAERLVEELNKRLQRPIEPFKLARRHDTIQRLIYDPEVTKAVASYAQESGVREDVAFDAAHRYAREIVPAFSATAYFGIATRLARWLSQLLFDVRVFGAETEGTLIRPDATVVFVMNHRSNMDYVLVTYLAANRSALSYAVGEWARIWPVSRLLRAMGAYFIRRRSRNALYRRVLARYVQMAVNGGLTQAFFPEGGLSLDGQVGNARLGLLTYILDGHDPRGRDVMFVPVSLNYDRVLEDNILTRAAETGERRFRGTIPTATAFVLRWAWRRLRGRVRRFGRASVVFGPPLSLTAFRSEHGPDVEALGAELMDRVRSRIPVLPVPLVAVALLAGERRTAGIETFVRGLLPRFSGGPAPIHPDLDRPEEAVESALAMFRLRHVISGNDPDDLRITERGQRLLKFYAEALPQYHDQAAKVSRES